MKKKVFTGLAIMALTATAVWNVRISSQMKGLSEVSLANVEALAQNEYGGWGCYNYICYKTLTGDAEYGMCCSYSSGVCFDDLENSCPYGFAMWPAY